MSLVGREVEVVTTTIQRTDGAAWKGDHGKVIGETGDRYRVKFSNGFIAEDVKKDEIIQA